MNTSELEGGILAAANMITEARYATVFTGAGISTPSGIPDFRGEKEGLWQKVNPMQVASHSTFLHNPDLFYDWFRPLFMTSWKAQPNPAHKVITQLEKYGYIRSVITQNIDGLHQKAGSRKVFELHGSALTFACPKCNAKIASKSVVNQFDSGILIPKCEQCNAILKPDVVLFEEPLPEKTFSGAEKEANKADLMLVVGSSLEVYPAANIPEDATVHGCRLIILNLTPTPLDNLASLVFHVDAAEFLPRMWKHYK
jgi:NAD-dependent deacetylase